MPDIIDQAAEHSEVYYRSAMHRRQYSREVEAQEEQPLFIDGVRCCVNCEAPIPERRIIVNPRALRCVGCQTKRERLRT